MTKRYPDSDALFDHDKYDLTVRRTARLLDTLWGYNILGEENVPREGAAIIDISHRSVFDPWLIAIGMERVRRIRGMVKDETLNWYYFGLGRQYFAPRGIFFIDRENTSSATMRLSQDILRSGEAIAIAQEGTHKNKGRQLGDVKNGFARIAVALEAEGIPCPVVPVGMNTEKMFRSIKKPINFVIEEALRAQIEVGANMKARRKAAEEFSPRVTESLQIAFEKSIDLRESHE